MKKRQRKPKHNWSNEGGGRQKMLNMGRDREFYFKLERVLEGTKTQEENKGMISATIRNKASQNSIGAAKEYVKRLTEEDGFEPSVAAEINELLDRYSTYR